MACVVTLVELRGIFQHSVLSFETGLMPVKPKRMIETNHYFGGAVQNSTLKCILVFELAALTNDINMQS